MKHQKLIDRITEIAEADGWSVSIEEKKDREDTFGVIVIVEINIYDIIGRDVDVAIISRDAGESVDADFIKRFIQGA